jgi:hypothetical protein
MLMMTIQNIQEKNSINPDSREFWNENMLSIFSPNLYNFLDEIFLATNCMALFGIYNQRASFLIFN